MTDEQPSMIAQRDAAAAPGLRDQVRQLEANLATLAEQLSAAETEAREAQESELAMAERFNLLHDRLAKATVQLAAAAQPVVEPPPTAEQWRAATDSITSLAEQLSAARAECERLRSVHRLSVVADLSDRLAAAERERDQLRGKVEWAQRQFAGIRDYLDEHAKEAREQALFSDAREGERQMALPAAAQPVVEPRGEPEKCRSISFTWSIAGHNCQKPAGHDGWHECANKTWTGPAPTPPAEPAPADGPPQVRLTREEQGVLLKSLRRSVEKVEGPADGPPSPPVTMDVDDGLAAELRQLVDVMRLEKNERHASAYWADALREVLWSYGVEKPAAPRPTRDEGVPTDWWPEEDGACFTDGEINVSLRDATTLLIGPDNDAADYEVPVAVVHALVGYAPSATVDEDALTRALKFLYGYRDAARACGQTDDYRIDGAIEALKDARGEARHVAQPSAPESAAVLPVAPPEDRSEPPEHYRVHECMGGWYCDAVDESGDDITDGASLEREQSIAACWAHRDAVRGTPTRGAAPATGPDFRPSCIVCGERWWPDEGVDATRTPCPKHAAGPERGTEGGAKHEGYENWVQFGAPAAAREPSEVADTQATYVPGNVLGTIERLNAALGNCEAQRGAAEAREAALRVALVAVRKDFADIYNTVPRYPSLGSIGGGSNREGELIDAFEREHGKAARIYDRAWHSANRGLARVDAALAAPPEPSPTEDQEPCHKCGKIGMVDPCCNPKCCGIWGSSCYHCHGEPDERWDTPSPTEEPK